MTRTRLLLSVWLWLMLIAAQTAKAQDAATIGETGYQTLAEAIAAANKATDAPTVILQADATDISTALNLTKSMTIDLNGHTISGTVTNLIYINTADITVTITDNSETKGGRITASYNLASAPTLVNLNKASTLNISNVTIEASNEYAGVGATAIKTIAGSTLNMENTDVKATANHTMYAISTAGTTDIKGGAITATLNEATANNATVYGVYVTNGKLTATGTAITAISNEDNAEGNTDLKSLPAYGVSVTASVGTSGVVSAGDAELTNCNINAQASFVTAMGIYVYAATRNVSGENITAAGKAAVTGCQITATAPKAATGASCSGSMLNDAIAKGTIDIKSSTIIAKATDAGTATGLTVSGDVNIGENSSITVEATTSATGVNVNQTYATYQSDETVTINSTATETTTAYGLKNSGTSTITGGEVTATAETENATAISAEKGKLTINGTTIKAESKGNLVNNPALTKSPATGVSVSGSLSGTSTVTITQGDVELTDCSISATAAISSATGVSVSAAIKTIGDTEYTAAGKATVTGCQITATAPKTATGVSCGGALNTTTGNAAKANVGITASTITAEAPGDGTATGLTATGDVTVDGVSSITARASTSATGVNVGQTYSSYTAGESVTVEATATTAATATAFKSTGTSTLTGGSLTANTETTTAYGVQVSNGVTTIDGTTISANAKTNNAFGAYVSNGKLTIDGATINANATTNSAYGVQVAASVNSSSGVATAGEAEIKATEIRATAGNKMAQGIYVVRGTNVKFPDAVAIAKAVISNSTIIVSADSTGATGINAAGSISIDAADDDGGAATASEGTTAGTTIDVTGGVGPCGLNIGEFCNMTRMPATVTVKATDKETTATFNGISLAQTSPITISGSVTVEVADGGKAQARGIYVSKPSTGLTLDHATISSPNYGIYNNGEGTVLNISEGTTITATGDYVFYLAKTTDGEISGGTYTGGKGIFIQSTAAASSDVNVSGGTFDPRPDGSFIAEGYGYFKQDDGTYMVREMTADDPCAAQLVKAGTTEAVKYQDLAMAIAASQAGDVITLLADIDNSIGSADYLGAATDYTLKAGTTLDGDGHTMSGDLSVKAQAGGITIKNVQFKNIHNEEVQSKNSYYGWDKKVGNKSAIYASSLKGDLTITGCTFEAIDWDCMQITEIVDGAVLTITDNTFNNSTAPAQEDCTGSMLRFIHLQVNLGDITLNINDNKFTGNSCIANAIGVYSLGDGSTVDVSGNYTAPDIDWAVDFKDGTELDLNKLNPAKDADGNEVNYAYVYSSDGRYGDGWCPAKTAAEATAGTGDGGNIKLIGDAPAGDVITVEANTTLSIAAGTAQEAHKATVVNNGTLILNGDNAVKLDITNNDTLMIKGGATYNLAALVTQEGENSTVVISGGTFTAKPDDSLLAEWYIANENTDSEPSTWTVAKMTAEQAAEHGAVASSSASGGTYYKSVQEAVNDGRSSIYLRKDLEEAVIAGMIPKQAYCTLYLNGHTLTGTIDIPENFYVTIVGPEESSAATLTKVTGSKLAVGMYSTAADVTIKDAALDNLEVAASGSATVDGGLFGELTVYRWYQSAEDETPTYDGKLAINGGTFRSEHVITKTLTSVDGNPVTDQESLSDYLADGLTLTSFVNGDGETLYVVVQEDVTSIYNYMEYATGNVQPISDGAVTLPDGELRKIAITKAETLTNTAVTYTRTFYDTNIEAWYVPFSMTITDEIDAKFHFGEISVLSVEDEGEAVTGVCYKTMHIGDELKANTPYFVNLRSEGDLDGDGRCHAVFNATGLSSTEQKGGIAFENGEYKYEFTGSYESFVLGQTNRYAIDNDGCLAYTNSTTYELPPLRLYMVISDSNGEVNPRTSSGAKPVRIMSVDDLPGDATVIKVSYADSRTDANALYDLTGRKVKNATKGVYISGGKKVIVK